MNNDILEDDCFCEECQLFSRAIRKMGNLFNKVVRPRPEGEVNIILAKQFAITINLSPFKLMNKKRWFTYSHDKQVEILTRIESKFRYLNPSVNMLELHFELAPAVNNCIKFRNMHIHALYEMPTEFVAEMETYYNRICHDSTNNWKALFIKPVYDKQGWIAYIQKDIPK